MPLLGWDILSLVAVAIISVYAYFKLVAFQYWKKKNVPHFEASFPFGTMEPAYRRRSQIGDESVKFYNLAKKINGWKFYGSYIFSQPTFIPIDLDLVKSILIKDFQHFTDRGVYCNEKDEPISAHLLAIGGIKWKNLRMKLTPTFTSGKMKMMFQTIVECGELLEKTISEYNVTKEAVDIKNILACFSTDIIGSCAFGLECKAITQSNTPFRIHGKRLFDRTAWENFNFFFGLSFPNLSRALGLCVVPKEPANFFSQVVKDTVEFREKNNVTRNDFLQILINIKNNKDPEAQKSIGEGTSLTIDEIIAQCFLFFIAGFETSSTTMTFALYLLSQHPEMQDKVREEIRRVLEKHNGKMTYEAMKEMVYMQQVIDETLRMFPTAGFAFRKCTQSYKVPNTDVVLDKGTSVMVPIKGIHYDEEYYPNPKEFNPERFTEEQKQQRHPCAYLAFGEGPRICIGMRFGLMQTKVGLASILKNYKVTLNEKTKMPIELEVESFFPVVQGGVWLNIEKIPETN